MAKVFLICGKICSGKGFYTRQLKEKEHAVVLSCDEIENDLFTITSATAAMRSARTSKHISTKKPWTSPARAAMSF